MSEFEKMSVSSTKSRSQISEMQSLVIEEGDEEEEDEDEDEDDA